MARKKQKKAKTAAALPRWKVGAMLVNFFSLLVLFSIIFILNQLGSEEKTAEVAPVVYVEAVQTTPAIAEPAQEPVVEQPQVATDTEKRGGGTPPTAGSL